MFEGKCRDQRSPGQMPEACLVPTTLPCFAMNRTSLDAVQRLGVLPVGLRSLWTARLSDNTRTCVCPCVCVCLRLNDQWLIIDWFLFISFGIVSKHFREALGLAASTCSCLHCCAGSELASALWRSRRAEGGLPHSDIQWLSNSSPMS